ncbi:MAG TPA: transposase [Flavipsychrobacter sp.]|nr:transposase [Flavipsychrobacter sp.]
MATRYRFAESYIPHFITFATVQWVDALSRPLYKDIIVESLRYCIDQKQLRLHAWVIMNNHIHLIISSEYNKLQDIVRDFKKYTSNHIIKAIETNNHESRKSWMLWLFNSAGKQNSNNTQYQFWQQDNHPITLDTPQKIKERLHYLHYNPVKEGIVFEPTQYVYSSAVDYSSMQPGLLPVELLEVISQ